MTTAMRVWLAWVAVSIVVAMLSTYALALVGFRGTDLAVVTFGWGMGWSAFCPLVMRRIGRWLRA